ncbi:MAG: hypothetical protein ACLUD1_03610 [Clostridia bacterium]|jgi:hypothetical protein
MDYINNAVIDTTTEQLKSTNDMTHITETTTVEDYTNTTNCLALTVKKEYKLTIFHNISTKAIELSAKVAFSIFVLNFLSLFL